MSSMLNFIRRSRIFLEIHISSFCLDVLNKDHRLGELNNTSLVLISKCKNPSVPSNFRPISPCNILYKIISKTVSNRLKKVLPGLISQCQEAIILNKIITENVFTHFELIHSLKRSRTGFGHFV